MQTHRYYSTTHQMKVVPPILTGEYLEAATRKAPPAELAASMAMPVPPALKGSRTGRSLGRKFGIRNSEFRVRSL